MDVSNQRCQEWLADYRRLKWRQFALERELNKMRLSERGALECDDENDLLLFEKHEKRLTFEIQVLQECLLQNEDHGAVEHNGWLPREHLLILRMLEKWNDVDLERTLTSLCGKSEEEIRQHLEWLRKSRRQREKQRSDVLRWKQDRAAILDQQMKEEKEAVKCQMKRLDDETRRRISAWKEERDRQRQVQLEMEEEEERCRRREELRSARSRLRRRDLDRKKDPSPERCDDVKTDEREEEEEAMLRRIRLGRLRKRDAAIVEERRNAIRRLRSRSSSLRETVDRTAVPRDPERLFRPTRVWEARCKEAVPVSTDLRQLYVLHLQKRAVPSWRNCS